MDLQTTFYIVAIIAFVLLIVLMVVAIYFVISLKRTIDHAQKQVMNKIIEYTKPVDVVKGLGSAIAGNLILKTKEKLGI
jgi:signal transduction histidine kinase